MPDLILNHVLADWLPIQDLHSIVNGYLGDYQCVNRYNERSIRCFCMLADDRLAIGVDNDQITIYSKNWKKTASQ